MDDQFFTFYEQKLEEKTLGDMVFSVIDFETTGLSSTQDRVIEVGIMKFTLDGEGEEWETFVDPGRPLPDKIQEICGITPGIFKEPLRWNR